MHSVEKGLTVIILSSLFSGCATTSAPLGSAVLSSSEQAPEPPLASAYRQLQEPALDGSVNLTLPDGFGNNGVRVVKRYFSASGKNCAVATALDTHEYRTFCISGTGMVNAFASPDHMRQP